MIIKFSADLNQSAEYLEGWIFLYVDSLDPTDRVIYFVLFLLYLIIASAQIQILH